MSPTNHTILVRANPGRLACLVTFLMLVTSCSVQPTTTSTLPTTAPTLVPNTVPAFVPTIAPTVTPIPKNAPPVIVVANPSGSTGKASLDVIVTDPNGNETIKDLTVKQEFNPQVTGNKLITEFISNQPLNNLNVQLVQPGLFKVTYDAEWPGRYPLDLTATDINDNTTSLRVPLEVHWAKQPFDIRGVGTGAFPPQDPDYIPEYLNMLLTNNVNLLQIYFLGYMTSLTSSEVVDCDYVWTSNSLCTTASPTILQSVIRGAHDRNIKIMLAPLIIIGNWEGAWRMHPNWENWFSFEEEVASYSNWLLTWARFAQENKVEYFEVGTELVSSHSQTRHWQDLVAKVRTVYSGVVGYGDNYLVFFTDGGLPFPACPDLDFYGMQFYFPATGEKAGGQASIDPSQLEMQANLEAQIVKASDRLQGYCKGIPVIISEMGVDAVDGANSSPQAYSYEHPTLDFQEQVDYYTAVWSLAAQHGFKGVVTHLLQMSRTPWSFDPAVPNDLRKAPTLDALRIFYSP